jgi:hypothetical protein
VLVLVLDSVHVRERACPLPGETKNRAKRDIRFE